MGGTIISALSDIRRGFALRRVWLTLAREDINDQHRNTALGPFWLLLNYLAFAGTFIFVIQGGNGAPNYPAYVATGLLVWFYIMETITQSTSLFRREEAFIKGTPLPLSVYILRLAAQALIRAGYATLGCLAILLISQTPVTADWVWAGLAILIIVLATPAAITVFAFLGAYLPDSQFIVANLMRIGMFLTPVFWVHTPGGSGVRAAFYYWNPFTYFLEIVRVPIINGEVPARSLLLCLVLTAFAWSLAILLLGRLRKQVVFVL